MADSHHLDDSITEEQLRRIRAEYDGVSPSIPPPPPLLHPSEQDPPQDSGSSNSHNDNSQQPSPPATPSRPTSSSAEENSQEDQDSNTNPTHIEEVTDLQKAKLLRKHYLPSSTAENSRAASALGTSSVVSDSALDEEEEDNNDAAADPADPALSYHHLKGGDVLHDIYKWEAQARASSGLRRASFGTIEGDRRAPSFSSINRPYIPPISSALATNSLSRDEESLLDIRTIRVPGGFRRNFLNRRAQEEGRPPTRFTTSFVDFLSLYGSFAGEDLEEIDENEEDDLDDYDRARTRSVDERTALLHKRTRTSLSRRRHAGVPGDHGDATVTQASLMLLKSFVGTGVLFLGRAFLNGGLLFSVVVLCAVAAISLYSFLLLVHTRFVVPGSFGDIGGALWGPWMRTIILVSITLSQLGFVAAYTIFVAENLQAFVLAVTKCKTQYSTTFFIILQLVVALPFAMIRNIQKLSGTALVADAFILIGIAYLFGEEISTITTNGVADIKMFNRDNFALMVGTAVFSFEGIGLVIPITESMREPRKFPKVLAGNMLAVMTLLALSGTLAYLAFGSSTQAVVLTNLPQDDKFVNAVQFLYSIAILLSTPLQLFPAIRIMENGLFIRSGKYSNRVKWQKNMFRTFVVVACTAIAWLGAEDLDKFVSLVGSTACVPLAFCYPPLLHYKACAKTRAKRISDMVLFCFGLGLAIFTSIQTISAIMKDNGKSGSPKYSYC